MNKTFTILMISTILLYSCSATKDIKIPEYTTNSSNTEQMVAHQPIPMPGDTTRNIVVYNVVEQKDDKKIKLSDETLRMLIGDFFGTITTIITVWKMQDQP